MGGKEALDAILDAEEVGSSSEDEDVDVSDDEPHDHLTELEENMDYM